MKRKILMAVLVLAATVTIAVSSFDAVSARVIETFTDHINAYGSTVIDIDDHPKIIIDGYHLDFGDLGSGDVIRVFCYAVSSVFGPRYYLVAIFTDIPQRASFLRDYHLIKPTLIQLVDASDIEVSREGKSKTIMIVWNEALEVPEENWLVASTPAFDIAPGRLIFRGRGDAMSISSSDTGGGGWSQTATWENHHYGNATLVCPTWHFGGPVGENEGDSRTNICTDMTVVSKKIIVGL